MARPVLNASPHLPVVAQIKGGPKERLYSASVASPLLLLLSQYKLSFTIISNPALWDFQQGMET